MSHDDFGRDLPEAYRRIYGDDSLGSEPGDSSAPVEPDVEGAAAQADGDATETDPVVEAISPPQVEPAPLTLGPPAPGGHLERVRELLAITDVRLVLPAEAFVHFFPASPEQVINAIHAAGFVGPYFESLGDELVAYEYLQIWRENEEKLTWIRSTSPLVVEFCRARYPELLPLLAPVCTPAVALARYIKLDFGEDATVVYAGLDAPGANGLDEFAAYITFEELRTLLEEREAAPADQAPLLQIMPPTRQRYISAAGGLPMPMLDQERMSSRTFRKVRGLHSLANISRLMQEDGRHLGFVDVLPFEGALDHPSLGPADELYWRRNILELAEPPRSTEPVVEIRPELDLTAAYEPRPTSLPEDEVDEVAKILEEVGADAGSQTWSLDPMGYASYLSLAESMIRGRPELAVGLYHISRNYNRALRDATHDALTDLYSYRALLKRVHEEMGQANRASSTLAMLFVDLDKFKEINDTHGHALGNDVLRRVASVLQNTIRSTDIAGRFGGDEFVVLLVNADRPGAVRVAEQVRQRIAQIRLPVEDDDEVATSASIGLAFHDGSERSLMSADDLFAEADASLYIAKAHGGNRVHPVVKEGSPA